MHKFKITKGDSEDIAFAQDCLISGVLKLEEFKDWLYIVVNTEELVPSYVWELLDLNNKHEYNPIRILEYAPVWRHSGNESDALRGIGYKRHVDFTSDAISREDALRKLKENPHIEERFRAAFPFIDY